jgi:hypothetical protein
MTAEKRFSSPHAARVWLWREIVFGVTYILRVQYKLARRNRYLGGTDDRQMTPRGYSNFNSYIKNLHVSIGQTDGDINLGGAG